MLEEEQLTELAEEVMQWSTSKAWQDDAAFWALVSLGDADRSAYDARLAALSDAALIEFAWRFRVLEDDLHEAAEPYGPPDSEDAFEDFLGWIVARGVDRYAALRERGDPQQSFDWSARVEGIDDNPKPGIDLRYAAEEAWHARFDDEMPRPDDFW